MGNLQDACPYKVPGANDWMGCFNKVHWIKLPTLLRSIHTCNLLGVNYCMNFSVLKITKMGAQPNTELFSLC